MRNHVTGADYTPQNVTAACFTEISQLEDFDYTDMGFAAKFWDNAKPVPMPKGFAPDFEVSASEATIAAGSEVTMSVNYPLTTLALKAGANDAGVTLESGVVTVPLSAAGKSFTVTATAFDGTVREKTFEVLDIEEIPGVEDFGIANLTQTSVTWSTEGFDGAVRSITDSTGKTIAFTPGEDNITVNASEFGTKYGEQTYKILTDTNKRYTVKATVASYVISDLATLKGWQAAHDSGGTGYVVMTENVDFGGATWTGWGANSVWKGTFDGRGKTIYNIAFTTSTALVGDMFEGTVKNLVMTDVSILANHSAAISTRLLKNAVIENCYISGSINATGTTSPALITSYSNASTATVRNCVVVVKSGVTENSKTSAILNGYTTGCPTLMNCIVIGAPKAVSEAKGFGDSSSSSLNVEGAVCLTQTSELDSFDYSEMDFTASLWVTAGKVPVPKGLSLNLAISTSVPEAEISAGSAITLSANYPLTKFTLSEAVEGISLEGSTLTIADSAAGKSFTVVATGFDGTTAQKTLTVVAIEDMPGVTDFNAFDLSKGTVSISTADFDGAVKSFADASGSLAFTAGDGSIEVAAAIFGTERGERTFTIVTDANKRYQAKAVVADYVISDVESLNAWQSFAKVKTTAFVALAAEIDYGSNTFSGDGLTYFGGIFDGRGHTISNIKFNTTGLCGDNMAGIVRNLAVKNTEISGNAGAIAGRLGGVPGGLIENCFVSGKVPGTKLAGLFVGYVSTDAQRGIKNCMAVIENAPENNRSGAFVGGFTGYPHWTIAGSVVVGSVAPVVMSEDGSASTEENLDALTYADAAAFETGAADAVAKLGSAWSWDAETKTLSLSGTAVYTVTAA